MKPHLKQRYSAVSLALIAISVAILTLVSTSTQYTHPAYAASATLAPSETYYLYLPALLRNYIGSNLSPPQEIWRPFNEESPWNTPLGKNPPIDPNSDAFIAHLNQYYTEIGGFGEVPLGCNISAWSIPLYFVDEINPYPPEIHVPAHTSWGQDLTAPIPEVAQPDPAGDSHLCIVDKEREQEWGFWRLEGEYPDLTSGTGAKYDVSNSGVRSPGEPACRESGFPLIAGLIRPEEIEAGQIRHALVFAFDARDGADQFVYPASKGTDHNNSAASNVLPMGARLQLKPTTDISQFPRGARIVAQAMKEYGMYLGDENDSRSLSIYFQSNGSWEGLFKREDRHALHTLTASDFRVIELPPIGGGQPWYMDSTYDKPEEK